jgi:hypothetical protein
VASLLLAVAPAASYEPAPVPAVDESYKDPALQSLRNRLLDALVRRDVDGILAIAAPNIMLSFGGAGGHADLRRWLEADDGQYWSELEYALRMGGRFLGKDEFWAPFVFLAPELNNEAFDPFATYVVTGRDVLVRAQPSRASESLGTLSHEVVVARWLEDGSQFSKDGAWLAVELPNDRGPGWIASRYVYSAVGYRLGFYREDGRWTWTVAIAGD